MKTLRNLSKLQILGLVLIPIAAAAVTWGSSPAFFRTAAKAAGVRVTQVCRPGNASYGARNSLHKRCLAMDIGAETSASQLRTMAANGMRCEFHRKGYYGGTADHYHCVGTSSAGSRQAARSDQRSRADSIRAKNKKKSSGSRSSVSRSQRSKASSIRRKNRERVSSGAQSFFYGEAGAER